ncbi:Hypothetical Protein SLY_0506 [Strawberry lethal yellows phytoplasma (CPA) str. NZSb11]|uniref:Uncharacterized protein n=1 Tax=Strawberry lethal yellows phytoplasma (CPA) str. NZSb11 TaxID=980422 RepID=R4RM95_PHYAS|nr:Hypothetical Protein SLY_0506 [Strawberry lethal yellows phytoplasma (CPA) str. NZSb11]
MYKLNSDMVNNLKKYLTKYHQLFDYRRCSSWQVVGS